MTANRIGLAAMPRELRTRYSGDIPGYRTLYLATLDGHLPAMEQSGGKWFCTDLAAVAEHLGLTLLATIPKPKPQRRSPAAA